MVKRALNEVIAADARILRDRELTVRLNEMGPTALGFVVRVWTTNAAYGEVYFDLLEGFKRAIDANERWASRGRKWTCTCINKTGRIRPPAPVTKTARPPLPAARGSIQAP